MHRAAGSGRPHAHRLIASAPDPGGDRDPRSPASSSEGVRDRRIVPSRHYIRGVTSIDPLPDPVVRRPDAAPGDGGLVDRHGRVATDLRVSLTDRCNLRCSYCMPPEGLDWLPKVEVLTDEEIARLVRIGVEQLGIREGRFTRGVRAPGAEPLLRPGLVGIVAAATALHPRPEVSLTTNAIGLARVAPALAEAGLDRINVSLDTLDPARFRQLTPRDRLDDVLAGLRAAQAAGLTPVKVNAVLLRGINEADA